MTKTTRDQFLSAAEHLFAQRGFYGASIAAIADTFALRHDLVAMLARTLEEECPGTGKKDDRRPTAGLCVIDVLTAD